MGKKHRKKRKQKEEVIKTPSFESPVCPTCGIASGLVEEAADDDSAPMLECTYCWVRFMYEDSRVDIEEDDDSAVMSMTDARSFVPFDAGKKKKKDTKAYSTEPEFGEMEELTHDVVRR